MKKLFRIAPFKFFKILFFLFFFLIFLFISPSTSPWALTTGHTHGPTQTLTSPDPSGDGGEELGEVERWVGWKSEEEK